MIRTAILLPLSVFPLGLSIALFVGWTLHQVPPEIGGIPVPPLVALVLVLVITTAGFVASYGVQGSNE